MKLNKTFAKIFGYFWRYGVMILGLVISVLLGVFVEKHIIFFGIAATIAITGLDYIIASALNMPHVFVVCASIHHKTSEWQNMYEKENKTTRKEMYKNGGFLVGLAVFFAVFALIGMFV